MFELCLNDVGMMRLHVLRNSCQNVLKKSSKGRVNGLISKQVFFILSKLAK